MEKSEKEKQKIFINFLPLLYFKLIETSFVFDKKDYDCKNHLPIHEKVSTFSRIGSTIFEESLRMHMQLILPPPITM
jgi:hypothetical protein